MASKTDQLLIVVSIVEGRNFPKNNSLSLVVQATFGVGQLSTDPVEHEEQPQINQDLAWEIDRRNLQQHRLQRTPIKLQCFAVNSVNKSREMVGYIVLDLRSAPEVQRDARWLPLLNCKYQRQKPALLVSLMLESGTNKPAKPSPTGFKAKKAPARQGAATVAGLLPERLEAVLVPDQGYHQVGPADHCRDMFVLSVTVICMNKLEQLISSKVKLSAEGPEFYFYYSLLGNDVTTEPFHNLLSPDFQPERASVRIRSSEQIVRLFLAHEPSLQIHLCCGNHSLGSADVALSALADLPLDNRAATMSQTFALRPTDFTEKLALPADLQPTVGLELTLRREDVSSQNPAAKAVGEAAPTSPVRTSVTLRPVEVAHRTSSPVAKPPDVAPVPPVSPPSIHTESEVESLLEEHRNPQGPADTDAPAAVTGASSVSVSAPKVSIPSSAHHYCFSLDLRSLSRFSLTHPVAATLRYFYQFFGSSAPVMTNPPVELRRNTEVFLPQSFCAFNFAVLPQQLEETFNRFPLMVELWERDSSVKDQVLGQASIRLHHLLGAEKTRHSTASGEQSWRRRLQECVPVLRDQEKVAELSFEATLDDLGLVKVKEVLVHDSSQNELAAAAPHRPAPPPPAPVVAPRDTPEYRAAMELELWKEEQKLLFEDEMKKKKLSSLQAQAEEWRRRDREREAVIKKKESEYDHMVERLEKTLADLEKRERQLERKEKQLAESESQAQRLQQQLQESSKRLQLDSDHRVALEREKAANWEARYKQLEKDFQAYKEQQNVRPEVRLQCDINLLTLEKVELERKLESTTKSKLHYKQQWGRALKELARFKQREQENAVTRLKRQQAELDNMRLQFLAAQEKNLVQVDRQELDNIKNQLERLQEKEKSGSAPLSGQGVPAPLGDPDRSLENRLSRLLEERDTLLRTGVYSQEDRIIAELDRHIREASTQRAALAADSR
ncbi:centrosomal protein of 120 kDa isoform X1 [Synchiropus splendidus]|uniref:centrosomal protein of 120 kDa isoform X1 n=1 Tax=Synchiropus splendidus TaxID=270530 RepID=UPI00237E1346|nr:centrosomal protein of 120 kDa isoform X1 [Synchiropus splendidus]